MGLLTRLGARSFQSWLNAMVQNDVLDLVGTGAPTDGTSGTGNGHAGPGSRYTNITNGNLYLNTGTKASPTWENITSIDNADIDAGAVTPDKVGMAVINKTGSLIAADKVVAVTTWDVTAGKFKIVLADADVAAHDDLWVTTGAIANNGEGTVVKNALSAASLNTNSVTTAGDAVYLDTTAGGFTATAPTGATARVVQVGVAIVKSATVGQIRWNIGPKRQAGRDDIQADAINGTKIADDSVDSEHIAAGAIDPEHFAALAVETAAIANDAVTSDKLDPTVIQVAVGSIASADITGTSAGQLGHANGVVLVAAPGAGYVLEFLSAVLINDFDTAAYTGGGNTTINIGSGGAALSGLAATGDFITLAADGMIQFVPLAATESTPLIADRSINLVTASAPTQPGTAAGVFRYKVSYRIWPTGL